MPNRGRDSDECRTFQKDQSAIVDDQKVTVVADKDKNLFTTYQLGRRRAMCHIGRRFGVFPSFSELDERHDRYERLVKLSRDVTIESKRIIFQLHRVTTVHDQLAAETILTNARDRLEMVRASRFSMIASELVGLDQHQYNRPISFGLQEYIEARSFYSYLVDQRLVSFEQVQQELVFDGHPVSVSINDYLCGLGDLGGELMRYALNSIGAGQLDLPAKVARFLRGMYRGGVLIGNSLPSKDFSFKQRVLGQSLSKVEWAVYTLTVRRSEMPEHMLVQFMHSVGGPAQMDCQDGQF